MSEKLSKDYVVLARKYRPQNFAQMKGQGALVRTLSNAIESGRLAHAFMLTGVRGIGKTTTARIIARALNCEKGPTVNPCGECEQCKAIAQDRNLDVIEMDAASSNSVEDIRNIIDSVQYAPVAGRYKIFILDEVHMLSKAAFNALLKTLEEPPAHVKFVFATTEIRKVPVTVLSRCQRFDLRRIGADVLEEYFSELLEKEGVKAEQGAIALIARAADGSCRDGLSLLDQAISLEQKNITQEQIRNMLGLVDRSITLDLFETIMQGDSEKSLSHLDELYKAGADSLMVLQDLLELTHYITKVKVAPEVSKDQALPEAERVRGLEFSQKLSIPSLTRTWQMLLKGIAELQQAFNPQLALEMLIIRLLHVSNKQTPNDLMKKMGDNNSMSPVAGGGGKPIGGGSPKGGGATIMSVVSAISSSIAPAFVESDTAVQANINNFQDVVSLFGKNREIVLQTQIRNFVHLVKFEQGHLSVRIDEGAPRNLYGEISKKLSEWTGERWIVSLSIEEGEQTLKSVAKNKEDEILRQVKSNPTVSKVLEVFPDAKIVEIKDKIT